MKLVVLSLLAVALTSSPLEADARPPASINFEFEDLHIEDHGRDLLVTYSVSSSDWRTLQRYRIEPRLKIYSRSRRSARTYEFRQSVALSSRSARVTVPRNFDIRGNDIEIQVVGGDRYRRIDRVTYGERCAERIRVRTHKSRVHVGPRKKRKTTCKGRSGRRCDSTVDVYVDTTEDVYVDTTEDVYVEPRQPRQRFTIVDACSAHTSWASDLNACIDTAGRLPSSTAAATVNACGEATQWASDLLACMNTASQVRRHEMVAVVQACDDATQWASDLNVCISRAARL